MEGLVMNLFGDIYRGKRVLVTGHTGFKGSWLALWLKELGAEVFGMALPPETRPNHHDLLKTAIHHFDCDIRDDSNVRYILQCVAPEIVFHLAAQPLVRRSYRQPIRTWTTNVLGTAHVLDACRETPSVRAIVVVTTDKCYANRKQTTGYVEDDPLGGVDPYSASKAATEILVASYRQSFFNAAPAPRVATVRAGNVIGGGDWSEDRLIPDVYRAVAAGAHLEIRSPLAVRPWQHVLESLTGYLMIGRRLIAEEDDVATAWNFGPESTDEATVEQVLLELKQHWPELTWQCSAQTHPHETQCLRLDISKAKSLLGWQPVWGLPKALQMTAQWYRSYLASGDVLSPAQLNEFVEAARNAGHSWTR